MSFHVRSAECDPGFGGKKVDDDYRKVLHGAYCAHAVDRDAINDALKCLDAPTCDTFNRCVDPNYDHPNPATLAR